MSAPLLYLYAMGGIGNHHVFLCECGISFGIAESLLNNPAFRDYDSQWTQTGFQCPCGKLHSYKDMKDAMCLSKPKQPEGGV